jgi:hypothetical protein
MGSGITFCGQVLLQWFAVSNAGSTGANELDGVRIIDEGESLDVFG